MRYSYQLRGTNGSGKTFVARELIKRSNAKPALMYKTKPRSYVGELFGQPFIVLGSYETDCGGCDTIPTVKMVSELLDYYMAESDATPDQGSTGIVFFEGLMISHMIGTVGEMQAKLGKDRNILAFLDTPLDKCIERVMIRRMLRKDERPFDPKNVIADHPRVQKARENAMKQGYKTMTVPWQNAYITVLSHLEKLCRGEL